ncbi:MAG: glycerophosphodiester phosphodiesterase [Alphaproteobacteria bacterium]
MKPKVIAHQGSSQDRPGNTWPAFEAALSAGADTIECDVLATADGELIIRHDFYLNGSRVSEMDGRLVRRLDPRTVMLADLIDWAGTKGIGLLLEFKDTMSISRLERHLGGRSTDGLTFGSFNGPNLLELRERVRAPRTSMMIGSVIGVEEMAFLANRYRCDEVHPCWEARDPYPHSLMSAERIASLRDKGLKVTLWHEEREDQLARLVSLAPDAICTNTPDTLRQLVDEVAV